ncbi:hypothetical protein BaRGS_00012363 [Batillaria attramentaria]|uniref:Uncharacterized protein n=1 Tax=Batillaria attramentaria TaxID=370345 RepID=A0ABD0LAZ8_9CAEN
MAGRSQYPLSRQFLASLVWTSTLRLCMPGFNYPLPRQELLDGSHVIVSTIQTFLGIVSVDEHVDTGSCQDFYHPLPRQELMDGSHVIVSTIQAFSGVVSVDELVFEFWRDIFTGF